jgi:hypothetical protein
MIKPNSEQSEEGKPRLRTRTQWLGQREEQTFWLMVEGKHYGVQLLIQEETENWFLSFS